MRLRTKLWIAIIAVCIGLSVYEIPKALFIWDHIRTLAQAEYLFTDDPKTKSALREEIMSSDPEAFDILRYCIAEPNDEELAVFVLKYPQNEFFFAQLADKLIDSNLVDSRVVLALTDRLIELSPNNAHYRYLKGWAILNRPGEYGHEKEALKEFQVGNELTEFTLPYDKYKERAERILDKADINLLKRQISLPNETGFYPDIGFFVSRSRGNYYPKLDEESFRSISNELSKTASRLIDYAHTRKNLNSGYMLLRSVEGARLRELDLSEEEAQQARFHLCQAIGTNEVLGQYDFEMLAVRADIMDLALVGKVFTLLIALLPFPLVWLFIIIVNRLRGRAEQVSVGIEAYIFFVIGLCSMLGLLYLIAVLNERLPGRFLGGVLFIVAAIIVWILLLLLTHIYSIIHSRFQYAKKWPTVICGILWAVGAIGLVIVNFVWCKGLTDITVRLEFLGGVLLVWLAFCVVIWAIATYWKNMLGVIPYKLLLGNRFVHLILVLLLMTGLTALLRPVPMASIAFFFLTILFVALISTHITKDGLIFLDGIRHFFGRYGEIVNTRTKIARITFPLPILYVVTVLVVIHISADKCPDLDKLFNNPPSVYRPLPGATQETYKKVLSKKYTADPNALVRTTIKEDDGIPEELFLASPEDLSTLISERKAANNPIREELLMEVLRKGGHDVRPVILNSLKDPNSLDLLTMRAKWKDRSVKKQLEQIFEDKTAELAEIVSPIWKDPNSIESLIIRANRGDQTALMRINAIEANMPEILKGTPRIKIRREHLTELFEIAGALAFVSKPQEAEARFSNLINLVAGEQSGDSAPGLQHSSRLLLLLKMWVGVRLHTSRLSFIHRHLGGVPRPDVTNLLKDLVLKRQMIHLYEDYEFFRVLSRASDRDLAEWVFHEVAKSPPIKPSYVYSEDVPIGRPVHISEVQKLKRKWQTKNNSYRYLEPIYPYLTEESIPLLLEHLDSGNEQLRAFVVWRLTSLGYKWSSEQLGALLKDDYWKVRLNALFGCDKDDLEKALDDECGTVRVVAQILSQALLIDD